MGLPHQFDVRQLADELADRYRFERELGAGGSASVWLAHDLRHARLVALKVLRPELCVAIGRERFQHEIRLTARLQHPHILPLLDSGEASGRLWYTMPFVEGESLRQRLARQRQLPIADALAIARQVAGALAYAHAHGVLHRDIKPDNIMLSEGGAQVADFGIARLVDVTADDRLTSTGLALGTPLYMSPEQVLGGGDVDHRTDQYALACTTYEMLAGEPPFTGGSAQSVIARRLAERAPSVRHARPEVPEPIAAALDRALDREPANRYATVAEFAGALDGAAAPATPPPSPVLGRRRRFTWLAVAGALLLAALAVWIKRPSARTAVLDADLVAILPFDVLDPSLSQWHEGMADVLARYLDGAGPLRTVPAATVLRQSPERSNRASADAVGRSLGANVVVFGDLAPLSSDSVRLRATVLGLQEGRADDIEVRGPSDRMGQLADSLGRATLLALGRYRPINAVVGATLGDAPLPALKAFLHGERHYRGGHYDSALVQYHHALQLDSTFGLAYMRMAFALGYGEYATGAYQPKAYYAERALGSLARLSPRDSLLIVATACYAGVQADTSRPLGGYGLYHCARNAAQQAVTRYPTDPESWFLLGEVILHMGGISVGEPDSSGSFERAIALDSFFTPAFDHVIWQAVHSGHLDRAGKYATFAAVRSRGTPLATRYALEAATLAPAGASPPGYLDSLIRVASLRDLWDVAFDLGDATDSAEVSVRIGRALHERHAVPPGGVPRPGIFTDDSVLLRWKFANMLATRGHLQEASGLMRDDGSGGLLNPYLTLALLGAIPAVRADSVVRRAPDPPVTAYPWRQFRSWSRITEWWRMRRDTVQLQLVIRRLEALANGPGVAGPLNRYQAQAVVARAYLTLVRGDSASALRQLAAIPDSVCIGASVDCASPGLVQAGILAARGRDAEAARLFDRWIPAADGPLKIVLTLERGRLAERMGDRTTARDAYQRVLDAWRHADPELDPYVAEARAGLARLLSEPLDSM